MKTTIFLITYTICFSAFAESPSSNKDLIKIERLNVASNSEKYVLKYKTGSAGKTVLEARLKDLCSLDKLKCSISHEGENSSIAIEKGLLLDSAIDRVIKNLP